MIGPQTEAGGAASGGGSRNWKQNRESQHGRLHLNGYRPARDAPTGSTDRPVSLERSQ
jgi:hypothetical protein